MEKGLDGNLDVKATQSSFFSNRMALSLSNVNMREWVQKRREGLAPWREFVNTSKFAAPKTIAPLPKRIVKNIEKFQSNYLFVFIGLFIFCILTSPMLIVAIAASLGACYIINLKNRENKVKVLGRELSLAQQYGLVGVASFPIFWLAGAGSAFFWVIGASFFFIMLHAALYSSETDEEKTAFDVQMEEV